ncbi:MAG: NlpC/P60 family protein, partial [Caldimicrobium sp.]
HLKNNKLSPNQKIIIGKITQPASSSTPLNEAFTYHTVKEGETLYRISLAYNIPVEELKRINHLEGNLISVGQKLKIPLASSIPEKPFVLESPKKTFEAREENLKEKFEKNIIAKNKILTPSMLSKDEEVALRQKFIEISKNLADSRYKLGGNGNGYLDCSAFVKLVYEELGIKLPRSSPQQFQVGMPVERDDLIPGDLVFFKTRGDRISHVGIYLGDNRFIHISSSRKRISIDSLDDPYFKRRYAGAKRVLNGEVLEYFQDYLKKNSNNLKSQENTETSSIPEVIF